MNTNIQVKTDNKYNIKVIRDGEVKEEYDFGNTLCKGIMENITTSYVDGGRFKIALGKGTGTPSWNDTGLFSSLWTLDASGINETENKANKTYSVTTQATFPANSSYVGNITEIGLYSNGTSKMYTHALITDAEGNPITINKTDLDILIVTATFITTVNSVDGNTSTETGGEGIALKTYNVIAKHSGFYSLSFYAGGYEGSALTSIEIKGIYITADTSAKTYKSKASTKRLAVGDLNTNYLKTAAIAPDCAWDLKDIFTPYAVQGASIGTGDGATTVFACPLSYFKEGTEKIYKNGALLTRGVDYTLENVNNSGVALFVYNDIYTNTTGGEPENSVYTDNYSYLEFFSQNKRTADSGTKLPSTYALSKDNPIYLDFGAPRKCNLLHLYNARVNSGPVTLSYSTDGAAYTPVAEITDVQWTNGEALEKSFAPITARYWRLSTSGTKILYQGHYVTSVDNTKPNSYLIYKTDGITFTQAPAQGDVLTMDATLDYPMKNDKHVIDLSWQYTVTLV